MDVKCECLASGICSRRGVKVNAYQHSLCQGGKVRQLDDMFQRASCPAAETPKHVRRPRQAPPHEKVGTALAARIEGLLKLKSVKGCGCGKLAAQMDGWGIAGCELHRGDIIAALVKNRDVLIDSLRETSWVAGLAASMIPETALRAGGEWLLNKAIEDVRSQPKLHQRATRQPRPQRTSTTRQRSFRYQSNDNLYKAMLAAPKPERDPFTAEPVFHFGAHLWPVVGCWEAHVNEWNKLASQITGRCFVGIAECTGCGTVPTAEVIARLSDRFEVFTVPNTKEGENPTFTELLNRIPKGDNDIFLYAHGKGMKPATQISKAVKVWVSVMYQTVIFNHREIVRRMAQGYKTFGSLRAFGRPPLSPAFSWHYAGTFFAVRAKHLRAVRPVKPGYGGVEAWPGNNFPANEAWCEFGDNRAIMSHYNDAEMCSGVIEGAVANLQASYARRHVHRKLIAVTTCNLWDTDAIRNDIRVTLDSIADHCTANVLVVDDGSPIEYQEYVQTLCRWRGFTFIPLPENKGIAAAKNVCLQEFRDDGRFEYLIMLDDDVQILSDEFESTYTAAIERAGVGILSWHDPEYTGVTAEQDGELMASSHTCGCCVVVSRECAESTGLYTVMPGKWGLEHCEYYQRAAVKFGKPGVYYDVPNAASLLKLASNESVFSHEEKLASNELNRIYLESQK